MMYLSANGNMDIESMSRDVLDDTDRLDRSSPDIDDNEFWMYFPTFHNLFTKFLKIEMSHLNGNTQMC